MTKREDEELCRSIFDTYLLNLFPRDEIIWTPIEQKHEPPDYYVELSGEKYAVEVTSLIERMRTGTGEELPYLSTLFPLKSLVDRVSVHATQEGDLHGGYLVVFKEPFQDFEKNKNKLEEGLLDYIRKTKDEISAPESTIYRRYGQVCTITKVHNQTNEVRMFWHRSWINVDGMQTEICRLVKEAVQTKEDRLRNISLPKIILLNDLYGFGEYNLGNPLIRKHCAEILDSQLSVFKAIFVIRDDSKGMPFYPEESHWKRSLFSGEPA